MASVSRRALLRGALQSEPEPGRAAVSAVCFASRGIYCRSCADACEARALRIRPALGGRANVEIDTALCTGCGECVEVCPAGAIGIAPVPESPRD